MTDNVRGDAISTKSVYALIGLLFGLALLIAGVVLSISGINGNAHAPGWFIGFSTPINDAVLGIFLLVLGAGVVWMARFKHSNIATGNA